MLDGTVSENFARQIGDNNAASHLSEVNRNTKSGLLAFCYYNHLVQDTLYTKQLVLKRITYLCNHGSKSRPNYHCNWNLAWWHPHGRVYFHRQAVQRMPLELFTDRFITRIQQ